MISFAPRNEREKARLDPLNPSLRSFSFSLTLSTSSAFATFPFRRAIPANPSCHVPLLEHALSRACASYIRLIRFAHSEDWTRSRSPDDHFIKACRGNEVPRESARTRARRLKKLFRALSFHSLSARGTEREEGSQVGFCLILGESPFFRRFFFSFFAE